MTKLYAFILGLIVSVSAVTAEAQEVDLTLVMIPGPGSTYSRAVLQIPDRIAKATDGRAKITINNSLVKGTQLAPSVRDGRAQMSAVLHPYLSSGDPRMGLPHLPGLIESIEEYKFVWDAFYGKLLADIWLEKWNSVVLAEGAFCTQNLWSKTPIRTIEDFKGKKIRVNNTESAHLLNALGAKTDPDRLGRDPFGPPARSDRRHHVGELRRAEARLRAGHEIPAELEDRPDRRLGGSDQQGRMGQGSRRPAETHQDEMLALQEEGFHTYNEYQATVQKALEEEGAEFWVASDSELERLFVPKYTDAVYETWYKRAEELGIDGKALVQRVRTVLGK